jgi:tetratricopeptide (TPR) repeat protein
MSETARPAEWDECWSQLGDAERWCLDFAALLGPQPIPPDWIYLLTRRMRGTALQATLSIRNPEAEAVERLVDGGWISRTSDRIQLVRIDREAGQWRGKQLVESPARQTACLNALSLFALERARALRKNWDNPHSGPDAARLLQVAGTLADLGREAVAMQILTAIEAAASEAGQGSEAERLLADLLGRVPENQYRLRHVLALLQLGRLQYKRKAHAEARDTFERVLTLLAQKTHPGAAVIGFVHCDLGQALCGLGEHAGAEREIRHSIALLRQHFSSEDPRLGVPYHELAGVLMKHRKWDQAVEYFERAIQTQAGSDREDGKLVADSYLGIATSWIRADDHQAALEPARRALQVRQWRLPPDHPKLITFYNILAIACRGAGDRATSVQCLRTVLDIKTRTRGAEHSDTLGTRTMLAKDLEGMKDYPAALECWEQIVAIRTRNQGEDPRHLAVARNNLAVALNRAKRHEEALGQLDEAMAIQDGLLDANDPARAATYLNAAITLRHLNRLERALAMANQAVRILRTQSPADPTRLKQAASLVRALAQRLGS